MNDCNRQTVSAGKLNILLRSDRPEEKEQAVAQLVDLLTSEDSEDHNRAYRLFQEGIDEALFCSCLNYGSLVHSFTHPLLDVLARAIERWAGRPERPRAMMR